jgi:HAD superfamily hydrolase (TIGR01450 family)
MTGMLRKRSSGGRTPVPATERPGLRASAGPLIDDYDTVLLDLDGVVYVGSQAVAGAVDAIAAARGHGRTVGFVTNNASRPPREVAAQLRGLGVECADDDVVTSAQAAARLLADQLPRGARVLVIGGAGLLEAITEVGLLPVRSERDDPAAVVSGFSPDLDWRLLAEATYAVRRGLPWLASNLDATVPTGRGSAPGNGAFVRLVADAAGRQPGQVAGKPDPALLQEALRRTVARTALFVGDRLDTDVEGARRAGLDCLLVLTGVSGPAELVRAAPEQRPDYVAADLGGMLAPAPAVEADASADHASRSSGGARCGGWTARVEDRRLVVEGGGDRVDGLRALCGAAWRSAGDAPDGGGGDVDGESVRAALAAVGWDEPTG